MVKLLTFRHRKAGSSTATTAGGVASARYVVRGVGGELVLAKPSAKATAAAKQVQRKRFIISVVSHKATPEAVKKADERVEKVRAAKTAAFLSHYRRTTSAG